MVREITGDLLSCDADVICHQVNYYGVMGGGIAAAIRHHVLTDSQYSKYQRLCAAHGDNLLGKVQYLRCKKNRVIANVFSQRDMSTDYPTFRKCMIEVRDWAKGQGYTVAVPGRIGCGIAGGNWDTVRGILYDIFANDGDLIIVNWDKEA